MDTRPSQALSGWQRWLGGKILLVQVTEGKMYLENRGWEGLTKHQDKWGRENKQKKKKSLRVLQFHLVPFLLLH